MAAKNALFEKLSHIMCARVHVCARMCARMYKGVFNYYFAAI